MKRMMTLALLLLAMTTASMAQNNQGKGGDDTVYDVVEVMPQFPGGQMELFKFLQETMKYPEDAQKAKMEGRVLATFMVDTDGSIKDAKIVKSVFPSLDAEALRVINAMPNWTPGKHKGKKVRVKYTIPISFRLN
ncbi:MAG: energy transducer TonB [Prevotella sp.]|nr:energy transducer TonB [Prevotella sp.]